MTILAEPITRTVAFYGRVSAAKDDQQVSTGQQRREMSPIVEAAAAGAGVRSFVDESISAWSGARRPEFEAMLYEMATGRIGCVVTWHLNRLARQPVDWFRFEALAIQHGVMVRTKTGEYDLSVPNVRTLAGMEALMARAESDGKSETVRRSMRAAAEQGQAHGREAYGWTRQYERGAKGRPVPAGEKVNKEEATIVREIAARIIAGDSLRSIVADLNARGIKSPGTTTSRRMQEAGQDPRRWTIVKVRSVVSRKRNIAIREHLGEETPAAWPAILDVGTFRQVCAILADPSRRTSTGTATSHLLSVIARCGVCGGPTCAATNRGVPSYKCAEHSHVSRNRAEVDALVEAVIVGRLERPDAAALLAPDRREDVTAAVVEAATLRAELDLLADDCAARRIDRAQLLRMSATLQPQLEAAQARARVVDGSPLLDGLAGHPDAAERWERLPLSRQRAVVAELVSVRIMRARQGARTLDPESIEISWKSG